MNFKIKFWFFFPSCHIRLLCVAHILHLYKYIQNKKGIWIYIWVLYGMVFYIEMIMDWKISFNRWLLIVVLWCFIPYTASSSFKTFSCRCFTKKYNSLKNDYMQNWLNSACTFNKGQPETKICIKEEIDRKMFFEELNWLL